MKSPTIAALVAAQLMLAAQPAAAAELIDERPAAAQRHGTFAGARLRVPLGGSREEARAGVAFTTTRSSEGSGSPRFAKGVELGLAGDDKMRLSIGGKPASALAPGRRGPGGGKLGMSTIGWVAVGVGVALVAGAVWFVDAMEDASE